MKFKNKITLSYTILASLLFIALISFVSVSWICFKFEHKKFLNQTKDVEVKLINEKKKIIKREVEWITQYIQHRIVVLNRHRKKIIKSKSMETGHLIEALHELNKGIAKSDKFKKLVKKTIANIKFSQGRGYFIAVTMTGDEIFFSENTIKHLKKSLGQKNFNKEKLIKRIINFSNEEEQGFLRISESKTGIFENILFISKLKNSNIIIAAGQSSDLFEKNFIIEIKSTINSLKNSDSESLIASSIDKNIHKDNIINQQIKTEVENGGGFISYEIGGIGKISYVAPIKGWSWYIENSINLAKIKSLSINKKEELKSHLVSHYKHILLIIVISMAVVFSIAQLISYLLKENIEKFSDFFLNAKSEKFLNTEKIAFREFRTIAQYANKTNFEKNSILSSLKETKEWVQTILNCVNSGVIVIDTSDNLISDVNNTAEKIFSIKKNEILQKKYHQFFSEPDANAVDNGPEAVLNETEILKPNGEKIPVLLSKTKAQISGKEYLILSFTDITEKKALEKNIRQSQKMEAIGTLAGGIAHEFNNILGIIIGYSDLAMENVDEDSGIKKYLTQIDKAGMRAKGIILQLLSFSRNKGEYKQKINLVPIVKESLKLLRPSIPSNIEIKSNFEKEPFDIMADQTQINQLLINLCTNSYHAMEEHGGELNIIVSNYNSYGEQLQSHQNLPPGKYLKLKIIDTGNGIPEDILHRIFEPYFTTKDISQNSGMGLAVVHGIVKNHNGLIDIDSKFNKGTDISIYFPAFSEPDKSENPQINLPEIKGSETILFVDDEKSITDIAKLELEHLGYKVTISNNPMEAIDIFKNSDARFNILITDMTMPEISGLEMAKEIKELDPEIRTIICTGFSQHLDTKKANESSIDAFIMKPYKINDIALEIRKILSDKKDSNT